MPGHILIADDHEIVRRGVRSLLSSRPDWQICGEAVDGIEAVEQARKFRPAVILMDISMPRMGGLEATRIIRRDVPEAKVIILSQNDAAIARRQAQEVDAVAFVAKSDLFRDLLPAVAKILGNSDADAPPAPVPQIPAPSNSSSNWLAGGGELSRLIREHDWSKTSLGPIEEWPQSLKTSVNLILNARHPMWVGWGKDVVFLYNDAYIQVLSLAKHPWALGKPTAEVWPEIWDICGPLVDKVFQKGEASFLDEVRFLMNRGNFIEETYYSFSYSPIRDESGAVAGLFCPSTEVTPKVIHARRLGTLSELSANALLQKTTESACASVADTLSKNPDDVPFAALYLTEPDGRQARMVQACQLSKGMEALAPDIVDLTGESAGKCVWPLAEVVKNGQSRVFSVRNIEGLPLGVAQQRLREAMVLPVTSRGEAGRIGVLVAGVNPACPLDAEYRTFYELVAGQIATAIQNARAAEEERARIEALAEIDRAKTAFFSNVSHEFRTPLTLMLGPVEDLLAKSHTGLSPAAKSQLELVNRNGSRLLRLVNTLLDFSRIEAGRMQVMYQPTDLAAFTIELASVFRSATEKAGLGLELDCPKLSEPVFVDRGMWEKIVLNLISNAFKFTFEGTIAVTVARAAESVELRVRDTGVGIPERELPRLFDRFHRVENTRSRTHEGSGIGLALVQELVKLHHGTVRVESVMGKGSTFIVSIPLGSAHLPADRIGGTRTLASTALGAAPFVEEALRWLPDSALTEAESEILPGDELIPVSCPPLALEDANAETRPTVLVADDNSDMRQYVVRLLAERYEVQAVPDGKAALASVQERPPDLVLSDVMMPNLDGFGLLRELRSDPKIRTIPVILLSARAGEESRVEGMEQGADDYLIKPFSARELLARVQTHLQMARIRKQAEQDLRESEERAKNVIESIADGFMILDRDWRITYVNARAEEIVAPLQKTRAGLLGKMFWDEFPDAVGTIFEKNYRRAMDESVPVAFEAFYPPLERWVDVRIYPRREGVSLYFLDVTERKMAEGMLAAERNVLEQIAVGAALPQILETLARDTEAQSTGGMLCSVLLFDEASHKLRHGAAPSLPAAYNQAIDGVLIGPRVGSCGTAAFERKPIFVEDIANDPLWADFQELALAHGLAACSSTPIFSSLGALLGTIAMYYRQPHSPSAHDRTIIARATQLAAIAIESRRAAEAIRRRTDQFETLLNEAPLGVYLVDADFRIREMNPTALPVFGNIPNVTGRDFAEVIRSRWPKERAEEVVERFRHTLETGEPYVIPEWTGERLDTGAREYYEWRINRIPLPDGQLGVVCYFRDISRHVRAREAIAESEQRLRLAQRVGHSGTWESNLETQELIVSPELQDLFGFAPGNAHCDNEKLRRLIHPDDLADIDKALADAIDLGSEFHVAFRITRPDGAERWIESTAQIFSDDSGKPLRVVGISTDITDRKLAERATSLLASIVDSSDDAIISKNLDGMITSWNKAAERMFRYTAEETVGRHISLLIPADRRGEEVDILKRLRRGERIEQYETKRRRKDGTLFDIALTISPVKDGGQRIVGASKVARDITARKRAEERERQITAEAIAATAKFHAVFEQTPVFAGIVALDGRVIDANRLCLDACGYEAEEVLGHYFWETGWWRRSKEVQAKIKAATLQAAQGTPYRETLAYHWADGTERLVDFAVHPIVDHQGKILFLHPTGVDITDLKRAEENYRTLAETLDAEVRARTGEVVQQSEQLRDLSSRLMQTQDEERRRIARELHDSAGQILAALGMSLAQADKYAKQEPSRFTKCMDESQELVQQLSQEIRTMSYLLHPPLLDETGLSEALRWYIQGLADRSGLEIALIVPEDFDRLPREMELVMFRLVQECLTNIHRHSGSKKAVIRIARNTDSLALEVQDEGAGISPEKLAAIEKQGSGVGIRGMRERVRHVGGNMYIQSNARGTTITFAFPVPKPSAPEAGGNGQQENLVQPIQIAG